MVGVHFVFTFYQGGSQCAVKRPIQKVATQRKKRQKDRKLGAF